VGWEVGGKVVGISVLVVGHVSLEVESVVVVLVERWCYFDVVLDVFLDVVLDVVLDVMLCIMIRL
jgi:hypothetical protein